MFTTLELFAWQLLCGSLLGVSLAIVGIHFAGRSRTLQVFNSAQGAELGSLLIALLSLTMASGVESITPLYALLGATGGAVLFGWLAHLTLTPNQSSRTPLLLTLWILLLAATQLAIAMHPLLESHFTKMLLGDLTTLTNFEAQLVTLCACAALVYLSRKNRTMLKFTFDSAIFRTKKSLQLKTEDLFSIILLAFSVWAFGFLFTCAVLFIPTSILSLAQWKNSNQYLITLVFVTLFALPTGFLISLAGEGLPTTPCVVVSLVTFSLLTTIFLDIKKRQHYR